MATRQRRLEIVIAWMQQHPGVVRSVRSQLRSLAGSYGFLKTQSDKLNLTTEEQAVYFGALKQTYDEMRVRAGASAQTVSMLNKTMQATTKVIKEQDESGKGLTKGMGRMGFRLGWLGYRMASMGRMILKAAIGPLKQMLGTLRDWEKGIESIAVALGLQEAGLGDTGKSAEELRKILAGIPKTGMEVQTAFGGVQAAMWAMAQEAAPALIDIMHAIQDIIESVGTAFIVSLAEGIGSALKAGGALLKTLKPFMPLLGKLFAVLVVLSPVLIAMGTAMFLLTPLMIAGSLGLGAMTIGVGGLTIALGPLLLAIVAIGAAITLVIVFWDDLVRGFKGAGKWLANVFGGAPGPGYGTRPGYIGPGGQQEITVYSDVNIESMTADVDYERVRDSVNTGVGDALRGRGYPGGVVP